VYVLSLWARGQYDRLVPGWSSLVFVILIVGGTLMIVVGFVGVYVGYIFQEVKRRPAFVIRRRQADQASRLDADAVETSVRTMR
jgi:dolichol-phosphate mannosyltransferase